MTSDLPKLLKDGGEEGRPAPHGRKERGKGEGERKWVWIQARDEQRKGQDKLRKEEMTETQQGGEREG